MTLPTSISLPFDANKIVAEDKTQLSSYLRELTLELENNYRVLAQAINGDVKSAVLSQQENWTPILKGTTVAGTFTYTNQVGHVFRQGLMVDCWFDVSWTAAGTATVNLYIELPY